MKISPAKAIRKKRPATVPLPLERRVLIVAPTANDARLTAGFINNANLSSHVCSTMEQLAQEIGRGCGVIVVAEEILRQSSISVLIQILAEQPPWSDIPVVLITSGGEISQSHLRRLAVFGPGGNVVLLERPFRPSTLLSALEVSLRSRLRQYEARDSIVELKRAHDEIQAASRAKDDFLAALSHELRTPLNPVLLVASEKARDTGLPEKIREDFEMIRKNIELEARLIDDLLDLTRISRGKISINKQPCAVDQILRDACATVEAEIKQKRIALTLDLQAEENMVLGDAVRLQQIFWNVIKNAVKFTAENGTIAITTGNSTKEKTIVIKVTDTGIGMTPSEIGHIFAAFKQGEHAKKSSHQYGGLGLGLAISRMLVKLHASMIYASSPGRGRGLAFIIEFPFTQNVMAREQKLDFETNNNHIPTENNSGLRILLVEDHEPTRLALTNLLTRRHHEVRTAISVGEAQALASHEKFDLVVSDIGLPDGTGYELMAKLRQDFGLKGIALTGYGMEQDVARGQAAGFITHLIKPIRIEVLEKILSEYGHSP